MKITFYAHASFRLETPDISVVTDPYTPGVSGFDPIADAADLVVMSSATDRFHSDPSHIGGDPTVVNALLDVPAQGCVACGVPIRAFPTSESLTFDFGRDPDANAMYLVNVGGVRVLHMGDVRQRGRACRAGQPCRTGGRAAGAHRGPRDDRAGRP